MLNRVGVPRKPCGMPEGQYCVDHRIPRKLTCCVLPVKNL